MTQQVLIRHFEPPVFLANEPCKAIASSIDDDKKQCLEGLFIDGWRRLSDEMRAAARDAGLAWN
jgi:hypothetical protein